MKTLAAVLVILLIASVGMVISEKATYASTPTTAALAPGLSSGEGFVGVSGTNFVVDGKPFYYAGANCYYLMVYAADPGLRPHVDEVLEEAASMGLRVVRTWAFNDGSGWNALQTAPGVYDETVFRGLDYVLHRASELGLRVILPLVNNWGDYGGMDQYVAWSPTASSHDDFYTDDSTRVWYMSHASTVISRVNTINGRLYRDDPTVFAWELGNEPRCSSDKTGNTLLAWIEDMSAYIKGLDPNHMVTTGIEGFYNDESGPWYLNGWEGVDYIRDHQVATIDFATAHSWPDNWNLGFATIMNLLSRQIADAASTIGKPFILEEFGKQRDGGGETTTRDLFFTAYYDSLYSHQAGGSNFWILYHDAYTDYDGNGVYYPADVSTVSLIENHADRMENLTLCGYADFRYRDIATNVYADSYRETYLYRDADVSIIFEPTCEGNFSGHLSACGLKPNFAYQVKLMGKPQAIWGPDGDDAANERIGYAGRWWEVQPNPANRDDSYYEAHKNDAGYVFEGYLLFDFLLTDAYGNAELDFVTDGSYHVLWWVSQRDAGSCDSPPTWATVVADDSNPAYDQNVGPTDVGVYAEIERLCHGETQLSPGSYLCRFAIGEESFHQSGAYQGTWAFAMVCNDVEFEIVPAVGCVRTDVVDIGDLDSEAGHNMVSWGPIEPATSGGSYGNVDDCRVIYAPESDGDGEAWATIDLNLGPEELTPKYITLRHLEGIAQDAFDVWLYPAGKPDYAVKVYSYPGDGRTAELWYRHTITVAGAGTHTLLLESTGPLWSGFPSFGQMAFDSIYVESCENILFADAVDVGADDADEAAHGVGVGGWGPSEPETHGGNWAGIASNPEDRTCRVVWEPGSSDAERNATIYLNHGLNTSRKDVLMNVLEGIAQDAFEIYLDEVDDRNLLYRYGGLHFTLETWVAHTVGYHATGVHTVVFRATPTEDDPWSGFGTYGKVAVRNIVLGVDRHPDESPLFVLEGNPDWVETEGIFRQDGRSVGESSVLSYNQGKDDWSFWVHLSLLDPLAAMGVIFDYLDAENYATAMLVDASGTRLQIRKRSEGSWSTVAEVPVSAPVYPVRLGLYKRGETVTVELGATSQQVPSSTDGLIGLITQDMRAEFSDVFFLPTIGEFGNPLGLVPTTDASAEPVGASRILSSYPNPFNPFTTVTFELPQQATVIVQIHDVSGRLVRRLAERRLPPGRHAVVWDGRDQTGRPASSGVYFCILEAANFAVTRKIVLVR